MNINTEYYVHDGGEIKLKGKKHMDILWKDAWPI
jgi:hypothetical protein